VATYIELLSADQRRMRRALESLIAEEENQIRSLREALEEYTRALDRRVIRAMVFRSLFGPTQTDTLIAQTDTEEASKPVTDTTRQLEKSILVLQALREALQMIDSGSPLDDIARLETAARMRAQEALGLGEDGDITGAFPAL
jgi:hypothetical protein